MEQICMQRCLVQILVKTLAILTEAPVTSFSPSKEILQQFLTEAMTVPSTLKYNLKLYTLQYQQQHHVALYIYKQPCKLYY